MQHTYIKKKNKNFRNKIKADVEKCPKRVEIIRSHSFFYKTHYN